METSRGQAVKQELIDRRESQGQDQVRKETSRLHVVRQELKDRRESQGPEQVRRQAGGQAGRQELIDRR